MTRKTRTDSLGAIAPHQQSPRHYVQILSALKQKIWSTQVKTFTTVNQELIALYWHIGKVVTEQQEINSWGLDVIDQLVKDLQLAFPGFEGCSRTNILRMQAFFMSYQRQAQTLQQIHELPIFKISWGHNVVIFQKIKSDEEERLWYAQNTLNHGWSRSILEMHIKSNLYTRQGKAITNFYDTLSKPHADKAQQSLKDPYIFNFLTLDKEFREYDLEQGLVNEVQKLSQMQKMLLELGKGFAFVGRQYHVMVGEKNYYIDLLFYHTILRCYIVVELKAKEFDPRDVGQLNFYLSIIDDQLRHPNDQPTIGLLLCKTKENMIVEYALRDMRKPMGVAGYEIRIAEKLPKEFACPLSDIEPDLVEF
jgi:predicted nuclease of restriction endonuclease-like (RecB) superfamily